MNLKHFVKGLFRSNKVTWQFYRKFAYARVDFREWKREVLPIWKAKLKSKYMVFLVLTPQHGNLGDHAITMAEQKLLELLDIPYYEITGKTLSYLQRKNYLNILNGNSILVNGGGNLGTLWFGVEELFRQLIRNNPKSRIVCLPNTVFYEDSGWGQQELQNSIAVYNAHPSLKIYARERISYNFMLPIYKDVQLVPDMVLSLNACKPDTIRKGCLLCLRNDCEKTRTDMEEQIVVRQAQKLFGDALGYTDMCVNCEVLPSQRVDAVETKFREFSSAELVITDRLHGMIFCAITGTPCIVIDSKSPKVCGCYHWIEHLDYIKFCDDPAQIVDLYHTIPKTNHVYSNEHLTEYYDKLKEDILHAVRR